MPIQNPILSLNPIGGYNGSETDLCVEGAYSMAKLVLEECSLCDKPAVGKDWGIGQGFCHEHFLLLVDWMEIKGYKAFEDDILSGVRETND